MRKKLFIFASNGIKITTSEELADVHHDVGIDAMVHSFDEAVTRVLEEHAPVSSRISSVRHRPKWYSSDVDEARRQRRRAERKWRKTKSDTDRDAYDEAIIKVGTAVCCAKTEYLKQSLSASSPKDMFRSINMLLNRKDRVLPDTSSSAGLANAFCRYFTKKIKNIRTLIDNLNLATDGTSETLSCSHELSRFRALTENEVMELVKRSTSKSSPADPIPTWLVKRHLSSVLPTLTEIVNASLTSGSFPSSLSTAIISPVLKKPSLDRNDVKNYRPVSNIRYVGKLIETAVSKQLTSYIESNGFSDPMQSAYRSSHSTETALLSIQDFICTALDHQKAVFFISLDLSSAFDTIDQDILLQRFQQSFGIAGSALNWFKSYLKQRKYCVRIDDLNSDVEELTYGIPQGSVIGPQCFTLYIRPLKDIIQRHGLHYHLYADDIQIFTEFSPCNSSQVNQTLDRMVNCLTEIKNWMFLNKLKLNEDKTEFAIFASPTHQRHLQDITLRLDDYTSIPPSNSVKILGCVLDKQLNMNDQITSVSKSVNYHLRNIGRIRKYVDKETCHTIVRTLITSRLDYCNSLYNGTFGKNVDRLQKLQNKAARTIYCKPKHTHTSSLINELHWLPIRKRIQFKSLTLTYKCLNNQAPTYLSDLLVPRQSSYNTRSSQHLLLHVPRTYKSVGDRAFSLCAPKLWNNLPHYLQQCQSLNTFKKSLKSHLF